VSIPAAVMAPVSIVDVPATKDRIFPPVRVIPCDEARPAALMPPVNEDVAALVLVMDPPLSVRPLDENNPPCPASTVPLEKVLVAVFCWKNDPPLMVIPFPESNPPVTRTPPPNVDVPTLLWRSSCPCAITVEVALPVPVSRKLPATESAEEGLVVPMPSLPWESMMRAVEVALALEVAMSRSGVPDRESPARARRALGDEEEIPTFPNWSMRKIVPGDPAVEEPMAKEGMPAGAWTESSPHGVEEPIPTLPVFTGLRRIALVPPGWIVRSVLLVEIFPPVRVIPCDEARPAALMPPVNEDVAALVLVMDPPLSVRPLDENNPPCPSRTVPLEKVLVALFCWKSDPPVMVRPAADKSPALALIPPAKVEVPVVDCRSIWPALITVDVASPVPVRMNLPATASWDPGLVVPMPSLPWESMMRAVEVADAEEVAMSRSGVPDRESPARARRALGDVVEMPTLPN